MNNKVGTLVLLFISQTYLSQAQATKSQFYFTGLGRAVVTSNQLGGNLTTGDTLSPKRGVSGYALFDLQPNLTLNDDLKANAILRMRNPFGSFFGDKTYFEFRQFQIIGRIRKIVEYEIGDIYLGNMSKYTMFLPDEMYNRYEADVFKMRRSLPDYENFIIGNMWRQQGVKTNSRFGFNKYIKEVGINTFGVRTNPTNETNIPDRVLAGFRSDVKQSDYFWAGFNYVGMLDIPIDRATINYTNHVTTGEAKLTLNKETFFAEWSGELGSSSYRFVQVLDDSTVSYKDFFYETGIKGSYKPAKILLFANLRNVGPQFSSPSAQTMRLNI
ncbi:MAG: hypothetical protein NZ529_10305 [Cytophagaceae bacterium]|nr:hypothetical protein [Cytophagaceae bacterium]MDW8457177.1 hypothetical protein [Cytophagaceae bacterium]